VRIHQALGGGGGVQRPFTKSWLSTKTKSTNERAAR